MVGKKASVLLSAGLTPSWSHGAATMGLLPSVLKTQRTVTRVEQFAKSFDGICIGTQ